MEPLNKNLYEHLKRIFGQVRITNDGRQAQVSYAPNWTHRQGRLSASAIDWGEVYHVCCPFCCDTRYRLYLCHLWGQPDPQTRDDMLHLCACHNEKCVNTREKQKQLHALIYPYGNWAGRVEPPPKPVKQPAWQPPGAVSPPPGTPLNESHPQHPARRYLRLRGFNPEKLASDYDVLCSGPCGSCSPPLRHDRIVMPIYKLVTVLNPVSGTPVFQLALAGWQARAIGANLPDDCPKYLTAAGMKKSLLLYGLPQALTTTGPAVIVEGITDAWKIGLNAMALLGKTISAEQCNLINKHFSGRPVVVWLDSDAEKDAKLVRDAIRNTRVAAGDRSPVVMARTPAGRKDPGECNAAEVAAAIAAALQVP